MHHSRAVYLQGSREGRQAGRTLATGLVAALLCAAAPSAALGQSAGDQQYADPLGGSGGGSGGEQDTPDSSDQQGNSTPSTPSQPQDDSGSGTTAEAPDSEATPQAAQGGQELPRTGYPAWLAALGGGLLLASGATLRVSLGLRR